MFFDLLSWTRTRQVKGFLTFFTITCHFTKGLSTNTPLHQNANSIISSSPFKYLYEKKNVNNLILHMDSYTFEELGTKPLNLY